MKLHQAEATRYARHLTLPQVGAKGQRKLRNSSVLIIGAGGLGAPLGHYLAAAGVGRIGIADPDRVELSNLQRQVLFTTEDVGEPKAVVATQRLRAMNPHVDVIPYPVRLDRFNAADLMRDYAVVADGTDNFASRYLINDASVLLGIPNVYGSIFRFEGQATVFGVPGGPCYRCLFREPPAPGSIPSCAEGGVLGVLPGIIGSIQAAEVLKLLLGVGSTLSGRLLLLDVLSMQTREVELSRDPACPVCGDEPVITELIDYDAFCGVQRSELPALSPSDVKRLFEGDDPPTLLDVRSRAEYDATNLGGVLVPLPEIPERMHELDHLRTHPLVVLCQSGVRSAQAVRLLNEAGFPEVYNLEGGLSAWEQEFGAAQPDQAS